MISSRRFEQNTQSDLLQNSGSLCMTSWVSFFRVFCWERCKLFNFLSNLASMLERSFPSDNHPNRSLSTTHPRQPTHRKMPKLNSENYQTRQNLPENTESLAEIRAKIQKSEK
jgi:hypothetical protein